MAEKVNQTAAKAQSILLSKWGILALGIGGCIGSGIITLLGYGIGITGHSVWLAFALALLMGFVLCIPVLFVTGTVCLPGGPYPLINAAFGKKVTGVYIITFFLNIPGIALYGVAMGEYIKSFFPGVSVRLSSIVIFTVFLVYSLLGLKAIDKLQKITSGLLLVGLATFIIVGCSKADYTLLNPVTNPDFLANGVSGLISASFLLMYAVSQYGIMYYGRLAKNPRKDIPFAILGTTVALTIVYIGMAVASSAVLPLEMTANQPLTYVAQAILPSPLFLFFMIAGPMMALSTSLSASFVMYAEPIIVAANDGWFPKKLAATNKKGTAWVIILIEYLVVMIPILLNWDIEMIANSSLLIAAVTGVMRTAALIVIPKRYPDAWKNRQWGRKLPDWAFYLSAILAIAIQVALAYNSVKSVELYIVVVTIVVVVLSIPYSIKMVNDQKITMAPLDLDQSKDA